MSICSRVVVLALFTLLSAATVAAVPNPPLLECAPPCAIGSSTYDLYASDQNDRGVIPFPVNWPVAPDTTTTVTVSSYSALASAVQTPNRKIEVVGDCSGGSLQIVANDIWVELQDGARIGDVTIGRGGSSTQRVLLSSRTPRSGRMGGMTIGSDSTDIMINGMDMQSSSGALNMYDITRVALINSYISYGGGYQVAAWQGSSGLDNTDLIIANTQVVSNNSSSFRLQKLNRAVIVDTLGDTRNTGYATLRLEFDSRNVWVRNFTGYGGGFTLDPQVGSSRPNATVHDITYYDSNVFHTGLISFTDTQGDLSNPAKVWNIDINNLLFHSNVYSPGATIGGVQSSWQVTNARYASFSGFPAWNFR